MVKLDKFKVRWIINQKRKGLSNREIASQYDISIRWVQKLWARYGQIKPAAISYPLPMGRPVSGLPGRREHSATIWTHHINGAGAVTIQEQIKERIGIHIPHNTIHHVLRKMGLAE